jgi:cytochrome c oxidase subunit 2
MGFPEDISPHGYAIDDLFYLTTYLTGISFVLVVIVLVYFLIRYREREGRTAYYTHGENRGAMTFHLALGALVFVMDVAVIYKEFSAWDALWGDPPAEEEAFHVRVVSERFAWNVHYPGADGVYGATDPALFAEDNLIGLDEWDPNAEDDLVTINNLHVPVNRDVIVELVSKDVLHSFFLPNLRIKQDSVPGLTTKLWFEATKTGRFEIACAELCGLGHYRMRGFLTVDTPEGLDAWMQEEMAY